MNRFALFLAAGLVLAAIVLRFFPAYQDAFAVAAAVCAAFAAFAAIHLDWRNVVPPLAIASIVCILLLLGDAEGERMLRLLPLALSVSCFSAVSLRTAVERQYTTQPLYYVAIAGAGGTLYASAISVPVHAAGYACAGLLAIGIVWLWHRVTTKSAPTLAR